MEKITVAIDPNHPELGNMEMEPVDAVKHYARCMLMLSNEIWLLKKELAVLRGEPPPDGVIGIPQIP